MNPTWLQRVVHPKHRTSIEYTVRGDSQTDRKWWQILVGVERKLTTFSRHCIPDRLISKCDYCLVSPVCSAWKESATSTYLISCRSTVFGNIVLFWLILYIAYWNASSSNELFRVKRAARKRFQTSYIQKTPSSEMQPGFRISSTPCVTNLLSSFFSCSDSLVRTARSSFPHSGRHPFSGWRKAPSLRKMPRIFASVKAGWVAAIFLKRIVFMKLHDMEKSFPLSSSRGLLLRYPWKVKNMETARRLLQFYYTLG